VQRTRKKYFRRRSLRSQTSGVKSLLPLEVSVSSECGMKWTVLANCILILIQAVVYGRN